MTRPEMAENRAFRLPVSSIPYILTIAAGSRPVQSAAASDIRRNGGSPPVLAGRNKPDSESQNRDSPIFDGRAEIGSKMQPVPRGCSGSCETPHPCAVWEDPRRILCRYFWPMPSQFPTTSAAVAYRCGGSADGPRGRSRLAHRNGARCRPLCAGSRQP